MEISKTTGIIAAIAVTGVVALTAGYSSMFGYNEAGQRHFVQTWTGNTKVVTEGGPFWKGNGLAEPYLNALRMLYTPAGRSCNYSQEDGFIIQYGDGGKGAICAQMDAMLPFGGTFEKLHQKYRSQDGIKTKLLDPNLRGLFTTTAELFTSTEAYETKRSQITAAIQDQIKNGAYVTTTEDRDIVVGMDDDGVDIIQTKSFSVIKLDKDGIPMHQLNKFAEWDMADIQVTITGFDFEPKTLLQISNRRDATNRGETAQAEAKAAYWAGKKAEAEGETRRITAQADAEVINAPLIADAKREAMLAIINAEKEKNRAVELTLAAKEATLQKTQEALAAVQEAKIIVTIANANAYKIRKEQEAGELKLRLDNSVAIAAEYASAIKTMAVPTTMIVGTGGGSDGSSEMQQLLQLQVLKSLGGITPSVK